MDDVQLRIPHERVSHQAAGGGVGGGGGGGGKEGWLIVVNPA